MTLTNAGVKQQHHGGNVLGCNADIGVVEMTIRKILVITLLLALSGCATVSVDQFRRLTVGMTKKEVVHLLGGPEMMATVNAAGQADANAQGKDEYFKYLLPEQGKSFWQRKSYFVRFSGGQVASFGEMRDIDSPQAMANLAAASRSLGAGTAPVAEPDRPDIPAKLRALKQLADDGVITPEDYASQKKKLLESYTREKNGGDGDKGSGQ